MSLVIMSQRFRPCPVPSNAYGGYIVIEVVVPLNASGPASKLSDFTHVPLVDVVVPDGPGGFNSSSVTVTALPGEVVANVQDQHSEFVAAIDLLFTGI